MELDETNAFDVNETNVFDVNVRKGRKSKTEVLGKPKYCNITDEVIVIKFDHMAQCFYCKKVALANNNIIYV